MIKTMATIIVASFSLLAFGATSEGKQLLIIGHSHSHPSGNSIGGGKPGNGQNFAGNRDRGDDHARIMRGPNLTFGGPVFHDFADQDQAYSCGWLHIKAEQTGAQYWWHRYQLCING